MLFTTFILYSFFYYASPDHRGLHSFPTRRSSDLRRPAAAPSQLPRSLDPGRGPSVLRERLRSARVRGAEGLRRSEEHTSELQSHVNLVCRLLLEKKKQKNTTITSSPLTTKHPPHL